MKEVSRIFFLDRSFRARLCESISSAEKNDNRGSTDGIGFYKFGEHSIYRRRPRLTRRNRSANNGIYIGRMRDEGEVTGDGREREVRERDETAVAQHNAI